MSGPLPTPGMNCCGAQLVPLKLDQKIRWSVSRLGALRVKEQLAGCAF
jgi:hypothetical protein